MFMFYLPALAIILYFCFQDTPDLCLKQSPYINKYTKTFVSRLKFIFFVLSGTAALLMIGSAVVFIGSLLTNAEQSPVAEAPYGLSSVLVMIVYCVCAAYLEESFFRVLLCYRLFSSGIKKHSAVIVSGILFAICHAWEGFGGMANAFLSALFLSFLFERKKSLNCIALSHALYNIAVYIFLLPETVPELMFWSGFYP
ncbi:MAG: CPBP family intramembrane metalloprotease [Spirochaetaceae bacterium]|nr:CPBP family intramembrane metalloprotease [Spirochaetaceae bacterium]